MDETPFVKVPSTLSASPQGRTEKPSRYAVFTGKMKNSSPKMKNLKKHGKMISFFPKGSQIKKVLPCHF